mmetsp:Transcript_11433/g.26892  ORF Transcript_11433/g.26892 Transcript_11433/m.26892 type:complete len:216 (-) Transcript_11433:1287-1934(-)
MSFITFSKVSSWCFFRSSAALRRAVLASIRSCRSAARRARWDSTNSFIFLSRSSFSVARCSASAMRCLARATRCLSSSRSRSCRVWRRSSSWWISCSVRFATWSAATIIASFSFWNRKERWSSSSALTLVLSTLRLIWSTRASTPEASFTPRSRSLSQILRALSCCSCRCSRSTLTPAISAFRSASAPAAAFSTLPRSRSAFFARFFSAPSIFFW